MGGKVWSREEEEYFWTILVPQSAKRLGDDIKNNQEQSWEWISEQMAIGMAEKARRKYTYLCVCEYHSPRL
jgi:hypothetical protein